MLQTAECEGDNIGGSSQTQTTANVSLMQLKIPSSVRMVQKRFDPETYEIEPEIKFKNDVSKHLVIHSVFIEWHATNQHLPS